MAFLLLGEQAKYEISMPALGATTLKAAKWKIKVWAQNAYEIDKSEAKEIDANTYSVIVDTTKTGCGKIFLSLEIDIFDNEAPGGLRKAKPFFETTDTVIRWTALR